MSKILYYYVKVNCFWDEERKNLFILVSTVSNNLNFALLRFFVINSKSLRNMDVDTFHNKNDAICNLTPSGLHCCFLSVKNMLEEGLEHDHVTVNTTIYCEAPLTASLLW